MCTCSSADTDSISHHPLTFPLQYYLPVLFLIVHLLFTFTFHPQHLSAFPFFFVLPVFASLESRCTRTVFALPITVFVFLYPPPFFLFPFISLLLSHLFVCLAVSLSEDGANARVPISSFTHGHTQIQNKQITHI